MRYAIIGSGMMGQEHIRNLALLSDAEVVAVADPDDAMRAAAAALAGPNARAFADHRDLLDADLAETLVIASPNHTHIDVLRDALKTDLPVLVEKPFCTTIEDCQEALALAGARGALTWVAMEYRFMPPVARLVRHVHEGGIGRLAMLAIREHRYPFLHKVRHWNRFARQSGGTMVEKCCHFFDLMRLIVQDEPVKVYASGAGDVNHKDERYPEGAPDILDNAYVVVDFAGGARAMLDLCMFAEASRDQEEIAAVGDLGKIECGIPSSILVVGTREPLEVRREHVPVAAELLAAGAHHGSTFYQHAAFAAAARTGTAGVTAHDGLMAVAMGVAAERSIKEGRVVRMTELGV